jgi:hypothetical protein
MRISSLVAVAKKAGLFQGCCFAVSELAGREVLPYFLQAGNRLLPPPALPSLWDH